MMLDLRHPWALLLLPLALWLLWRAPYRWGIPRERPVPKFVRWCARLVPLGLAVVLVLAAAGPELRRSIKGFAPVVDFAVVLDGSSSMLAKDDAKESRWDAARRILLSFIARRPEDRFALVLFSAHPVTLAPLTADHERILLILERLRLESRDDGTAIGSALMTAVRRLADSPARSRVILLLTDGAQNRGRVTPAEAATEAKRLGIRIHTVIVGGKFEALVPLEGGGQAMLKVATDPETLQQVAQTTGGEAFQADDPTGMARSLQAIDQLEKTALPVEAPSEGRPLGRWFLLAGALLALPLAVDLTRKRGTRPPPWLVAP